MASTHTDPEQVEHSAPQRGRVTAADAAEINNLDYLERNKEAWQRWAPSYAAAGHAAWEEDELRWGMWGIPESDLGLFSDLEPGDVIELGCGTAALPAWLARRGFRSVGIDFARKQLEIAARYEKEFDVWFPLLCANAEHLHFDHSSFDCVVSEYGASLWCNPRRWIPEAARLLRPGGRLIFITSSALLITCTPDDGSPATDRLVRDYFSRFRIEFQGDDTVEFHMTHGRWIRLLRANGFVLENLIETRPPPGVQPRFPFASEEWAQRWASEEIWIARKEAAPESLSS